VGYHKLTHMRIAGALAALLLLLWPHPARAQNPAYAGENHGFTAFVEARGSTSKQGQFTLIDASIGYDFNDHVGFDFGVPYYFVRATPNFAPGETHQWNNNLGDPYFDLRFTFDNHVLNYATVLTATIPVAETGAFSTGRVGLDWFNHFDKPIWRVTPYVNAGISNGLLDTRLLSQPFRLFDSFKSLGFLADVEGGITFRVANRMIIGSSYYEYIPSGSQKLYSAGGIQNFFLLPNGFAGNPDDVLHDRGYTAFIRLNPFKSIYIEPAYVHSTKFDIDAATVTVGIDLRGLFGGRQRHY
jgi:hypothetical protein